MSDFGGKLRLARERRGISLRQIAASTKISVAALEALERNDVSKLPGGIFSRAFVRSYAVEVGLDPDVTVREFLERFQGDAPSPTAVQTAVSGEDSAFESQQRIASVLLKLVLISIPLVGIILYFTMRSRPGRITPAAAAVERPLAPPPDPPSQAPPVVIPASASPEAARQTMTLELRATGDCWVKLTIDGASIPGRVMRAGEKEVREVRETALVDVGNAGAFAYSINGRPGKPLGESGQVRTMRLTKDTMAEYLQ